MCPFLCRSTVLVLSLVTLPVVAQTALDGRLRGATLQRASDTEDSLLPTGAAFENPFGDAELERAEPEPTFYPDGPPPDEKPPLDQQDALNTPIEYGSEDPPLDAADGFDPDSISFGDDAVSPDKAGDLAVSLADPPPQVDATHFTRFVRGDVDASTAVDGTDLVVLAERIAGTGNRVACDKAADLDDDGDVLPADLVLLLDLLTLGTPTPPTPFPSCGTDPSLDGLSCRTGCP